MIMHLHLRLAWLCFSSFFVVLLFSPCTHKTLHWLYSNWLNLSCVPPAGPRHKPSQAFYTCLQMDLCPYGLPGPLFTRGQALQCMKWTFSSPELPELINPLLRLGQSFWETRSIGLCIPQGSLCLASCVSVQEKSVSSSTYLCFGIGGGRRLRKREGIKFPKFACCHQLPGTCHGRKPT